METRTVSCAVTPVVVAADRRCEVVIRSRAEPACLVDGREYVVRHTLMEDSRRRANTPLAGETRVRAAGGGLRVRSFFEGEQEHCLQVCAPQPDGSLAPVATLRVYSLKPDLYRRRPYKGDFHIHSNRSDGRESPAYVAAACRRIGMDFMAVTDHGQYAPSLEAISAFSGVPSDLRIYPGEEVHLPRHPVHMIHFGGRFSVNEAAKGPAYEPEVERIRRRLARRLPPGVDPYIAAGCVWAFTRIREADGLGVFCHPHWMWGASYNVAAAVNEWLFAKQPFDAFEVIGGYWSNEVESNFLQVLWYHEQRAQGRTVPIVGASDAHGCERGGLFGWYYTIVFAPECEFGPLCEAVRGCWSVAVEALPGQTPRAHGPYRLARYAQFLLREVLPLHDGLCVEEGRLLGEHVSGSPSAARSLAPLGGRCARLLEQLWGPPAR